jgi:DNA-binding CsgD family transcriptional regulator
MERHAATSNSPYPSSELTPREYEVIACILDCLGNEEIAAKLGISKQTVKRHISNIFDKVGCSTRLECYRHFAPSGEREEMYRAENLQLSAEIERLRTQVANLESLIFRGLQAAKEIL